MYRLKRFLCYIISTILVISCLPLDSIADEVADSLKCRSVSEASYSVRENVVSSWSGHANIELVFTNTGDKPICNWNYTFEYLYNIENPYNCSVVEHEGDLYTITNAGWNKDINPGASVTIGFTASSNDGSDIEYMPSFYLLNNAKVVLPEGSLSVDYVEYSDWASGSSGALILTNKTGSSIGDWTITFSANRSITAAYNVSFADNGDGTYSISGSNYCVIPAYSNYQFGIQCGAHDSSVPFEISNLTVSSSTLALDLNDDVNGNGVPDVEEINYNGYIPTATPEVTDTPVPTTTTVVTVTPEPTVTAKPTVTATAMPTTTIEPTVTVTPTDTPEPTPTFYDISLEKDIDGDGLYTSDEELFGTDPNNPDSDYDGVSDGNEIRMMYSPTNADSNLNGVLDGDEDYDDDGIINRNEESYGTCPYIADSDFDGINDYDELFSYGTDPNNDDSDGDYILDGDELKLGLDPATDTSYVEKDNENTKDYSFSSVSEQITEFNTDDQPFSFSFDITAAGRVDKYISVEETGYKYAIEDNTTILGKTPEIVYDDNMKIDSVTVNFTMKNGYETDIDKYSVFYYWEGYNLLIPIETEYDYVTGTVSATNPMTGTYCLVDTYQMYDLLGVKVEETANQSNSRKSVKGATAVNETDSDSQYTVVATGEYNGHSYIVIESDTPITHDEAVAVCDIYGGYPAVITSDEENNFVAGITWSGWIGGNVTFQAIKNPSVNWITGEECTYTYWGFGIYDAYEMKQYEGWPVTFGIWGWNWRDPETYTDAKVICECSSIGKTVSALTFGDDDIELNCYSDSDKDSDGLLDYQELSHFDLGSFDSTTGAYKSASFDDYFKIAKNIGINVDKKNAETLKKFTARSYNSDVTSADKDRDNYSDLHDAHSLKKMLKVNYILYDGSEKDFEENAKFWERRSRMAFTKKCMNADELLSKWKMMGLNAEGKQEFEIDTVYLLFHGFPGCILLDGKNAVSVPINERGKYTIDELATKKMNRLVLNICFSANVAHSVFPDDPFKYGYNIALGFYYLHPEISEIVGWDGRYMSRYSMGSFEEYGLLDGLDDKNKQNHDYYGWIYKKNPDGTLNKSHTYKSTVVGFYIFI